jgi:chromosome segregation ATPase
MHEVCELCLVTDETPEGGTVSGRTYSEDELRAAIEEATTPLAAQLVQLQAAAQQSEITAQLEAIKAEHDSEVEELRAQLDTAVLERQAAIDELTSFQTDLEELVAADEAARESAARLESRLARVREVASFPEEHIEANAERWAALSDEDFEARVAEWAALQTSKGGDLIPKHTALTASRETTTDTTGAPGLMREVMRMRFNHVDPRTL